MHIQVLALAVLLLMNKVKELKGAVERVSNLFFPNVNPENDSDGKVKARNEKLRGGRCLNGNFESPPCVHMNVKVHGWVFEVSKCTKYVEVST